MNRHCFFSKLCDLPIPRSAGRLAVLLFVLAWSSSAFSGEIHEAAIRGDLEKVKQLLKDNPTLISRVGEYGRTALHMAAEKGHKDVVAFLLDNNADLNATNDWGQTPLHSAAMQGYGAGLMSLPFLVLNGNKSLSVTNEQDYVAVVRLLLAHGADVNVRDIGKVTPLHLAVISGMKDVAALLLKNKADVNSQDDLNGLAPLHIAAMTGQKDMTTLLLKNSADVNEKETNGWTPLHAALTYKQDAVADLLHQHGGHE